MQDEELKENAGLFIDYTIKYFKNNKVKNFGLQKLDDNIYLVTFEAYDFFYVYCEICLNSIFCYIKSGSSCITLVNSKEVEIKDFNDLLRNLEMQIELRIPDKFLISRGWL